MKAMDPVYAMFGTPSRWPRRAHGRTVRLSSSTSREGESAENPGRFVATDPRTDMRTSLQLREADQ